MYQYFFWYGALTILTVVARAQPSGNQNKQSCMTNAADIFFILDSSSSIWIVDYKKQLKFVADVVDSFNIGRKSSLVRVGAITFSDRAYLEFPAGRYTDPTELKNAILNISYRQGRTNTADALRLLKEEVEPYLKDHDGAIIAIVITDGRSTDHIATSSEARNLHKLGINVYAIGVGDSNMYDIDELKAIASDSENSVYTVASYSALKDIAQKFHIQPCEETTTKPTTTPTPTTTTKAPTTTATTTTTTTTTLPPTTIKITEKPIQTEAVKKDPASLIIFGFDMFTMGHYRTRMLYQFIDTFLPFSGYGRFSVSSFAYCPDNFNVPVTSLMKARPYDPRYSVPIGSKLPGLVEIVRRMAREMETNIARNPFTGRLGNQVAVLFIDPTVTVISQELVNATNVLKRQGAKVFLINVGQYSWNKAYDLSSMSSQPYHSYIFNYPTYDQLLFSIRKTPFRFRAMCNKYVTPPSLYGIRI